MLFCNLLHIISNTYASVSPKWRLVSVGNNVIFIRLFTIHTLDVSPTGRLVSVVNNLMLCVAVERDVLIYCYCYIF